MKTSTAILLCSLFGINPALVRGTAISQWNFDSGSVGTQAAAVMDLNATASSFNLSSGTVVFYQGNPPSGQAIGQTGWNVSDGVKWWDFTITANAGFLLDLATLTFDDQRSGTGPVNWSVTINGVSAASGQFTHTTFSTDSITLPAGAFQDLPSAEIKIFGYGATSSAGTWRLDNVTLNGMVLPVPDSMPSLAGLGCVLGLLAVLRRITSCSSPLPRTNG